jgi:hypothetical protein
MYNITLITILCMLASPSYWWFELNNRCYIRSKPFPESVAFEVPCKFLKDITIPFEVIDKYLDDCDNDRKCIVYFL